MKQLSGLDTAFLNVETGAQYGHVAGLCVFARPTTPGYDPYAAWRAQLEERLHVLEPLRRRLAEVPMGLDNPYWIEDPDFDLDFHVRHSAVPPPGRDDQLLDVASRIVARPLDRARPLWLSYVIEGLSDDRFAVLTLVHHATIDGASGAELFSIMLDDRPEGSDIPPPDAPWRPEHVPSGLELMVRGMAGMSLRPARAMLFGVRAARELARATRNPALVAAADQAWQSMGLLGPRAWLGERDDDRDRPPARMPRGLPPRTPFNAPITAHRKLAIRTSSLTTVRAIKSALGATVNDVVLAVCAGGLRAWLERHDALPDDPLVAMVPVSIRTGKETERWTNRVSMLTTALPTDEPDPVERVRRVHDAIAISKELFQAIPADQLTDFAEFSPPAVFARAMRLSTRLELGSRLTPGNLVVSNVPGPRAPLYAAGARMLHYYPVSMIVEGQGLNITVQSYLDNLDWGLVCCPELVPDLEFLLDAIEADIGALAAVTGNGDGPAPGSR